ncbi:alpha/beta hydrolase [Paenibacillus aurantius]|uniref:Alpha/beta hydrolase n=1 Tax=Paenibacillus aurantius TaxID=2918900 RepID=A0AA96RFM6_9BACL|nr:alpha/beta hydrolase [Paenibacillus aurantius]WNQ12177.1 alpha/beta hydrolase [Paenibacillus aurantius]
MKHPITEQEVTIHAAYELAGAMTLPGAIDKKAGERNGEAAGQETEAVPGEGGRPDRGVSVRYPAILIIPGTGGNDRDGNSRMLRMNLYKDLAHVLTGLGWATLRYDKRGIGRSKGSFLESGMWDQVDDAEACLRYLEAHPQVDPNRILILGHSEGCILGPALNARHPVSGLILLAGVAGSLKDALPMQNERAIGELEALTGFKGFLVRLLKVGNKARKQQGKLFRRLEQSTVPVIRVQGKKLNAKWFREHLAYNVMDDLAKAACPTLAVTGDKDLQVDPADAERMAAAVKGEGEWRIIPNMTHILKITEETPAMLTLIKQYKRMAGEPIAPELAEVLQQWLQAHYERSA